jgi:hypothetical protein
LWFKKLLTWPWVLATLIGERRKLGHVIREFS